MEVASSDRVDFAASQESGFIWPDFLPAYDATATLVKLLDLLAVDRPQALRRSSATLPVDPHRARDGADAVGAQGRGHARDGGAGRRAATSCSSTA